jgi:hypothetical protein
MKKSGARIAGILAEAGAFETGRRLMPREAPADIAGVTPPGALPC